MLASTEGDANIALEYKGVYTEEDKLILNLPQKLQAG